MNSQQAPLGETVRDGGVGFLMSDAAELFKAVAHPVRAHILELLCRGESSIPELCEGTGVKPAHLSRHLTDTEAAGSEPWKVEVTGPALRGFRRLPERRQLPSSNSSPARLPTILVG